MGSKDEKRTEKIHKVQIVTEGRFWARLMGITLDKEVKEVIVIDKVTGKIKEHTYDGKPVDHSNDGLVEITADNASQVTVQFLEQIKKGQISQFQVMSKILLQLTEMNYYLSYLEPKKDKDKDETKVKEYLFKRGYREKIDG